jgi:hypothetical protein
MQARTLSFFINREVLDEVMEIFDTDVLPRFLGLPHFLGLIVVDTEDVRHEVLGLSVWDGDLDDSEEIVSEFRRRLVDIAGTSPTSKAYEVLRLIVNEPGGD